MVCCVYSDSGRTSSNYLYYLFSVMYHELCSVIHKQSHQVHGMHIEIFKVMYHICSEMHCEAELFHLVISLVTNCSNKWFAACYIMEIFKVVYHVCSEMYCEVTISLTDCSHEWYVAYCIIGASITLQMGVLTVATNS